jgi:hypothetical protein
MKHAGGGFDYSYSAQAAVDDSAHIIVAAELTNNSSDSARLASLLEAVKQTAGTFPERVLADAGFRSEAEFKASNTTPPNWSLRWGARVRSGWRSTRPGAHTPQRWRRSSRPSKPGWPVSDTSGSPSHRTAG